MTEKKGRKGTEREREKDSGRKIERAKKDVGDKARERGKGNRQKERKRTDRVRIWEIRLEKERN